MGVWVAKKKTMRRKKKKAALMQVEGKGEHLHRSVCHSLSACLLQAFPGLQALMMKQGVWAAQAVFQLEASVIVSTAAGYQNLLPLRLEYHTVSPCLIRAFVPVFAVFVVFAVVVVVHAMPRQLVVLSHAQLH